MFVVSALIAIGAYHTIKASEAELKDLRLDDSQLAQKYYGFVYTNFHDATQYLSLPDDKQVAHLRNEMKIIDKHITEYQELRNQTSSPFQQGLLYLMTATCHQVKKQIHLEKIGLVHNALNPREESEKILSDAKSINELMTAKNLFTSLLAQSLDRIEALEGKKVNRAFIMYAQASTLKNLAYLSEDAKSKLPYLNDLYDIAQSFSQLYLLDKNSVYHQVCLESGHLFKSLAYIGALGECHGSLSREELLSIPPETVLNSIRVYRDITATEAQ